MTFKSYVFDFIGAADEARTRDPQLGKLILRFRQKSNSACEINIISIIFNCDEFPAIARIYLGSEKEFGGEVGEPGFLGLLSLISDLKINSKALSKTKQQPCGGKDSEGSTPSGQAALRHVVGRPLRRCGSSDPQNVPIVPGTRPEHARIEARARTTFRGWDMKKS